MGDLMSGTDAIGGFAYQHAQAIQAALRIVEEPELERIRVEADNDVIDVEIWSHSGDLIDAYQYKRRNERYVPMVATPIPVGSEAMMLTPRASIHTTAWLMAPVRAWS